MKINIPCPECGCQYCDAETKAGEKVRLEICRCDDGSGEFDVAIFAELADETKYEKHQCSESDIESCLSSRFQIDLATINHQCFN